LLGGALTLEPHLLPFLLSLFFRYFSCFLPWPASDYISSVAGIRDMYTVPSCYEIGSY
jgi:hypothetical protein